MKYSLDFFTQYGQFYIVDENHGDTDGPDYWNADSFDNRLATSEGNLGVRIENDECKAIVSVEVLEEPPVDSDFEDANHVVEGSINIDSGILQIQDCPTSSVELEIPLEKGTYRVRVYSYDLDMGYDEVPQDHYKIEIWKAAPAAVSVLKHWTPNY